MAEQAADSLRRTIEAFGTGGTEAALRHLHPEILWLAPPEWLEERMYRGHEGVRELASYWLQQFDDYRLDLERVIDLGDGRAVALLYQRGRIKESGDAIEHAIGYVAEARDGKLIRVDVYFSWEDTLAAAGLEE
jgi:ketosteroid isomerase-like protein